MDQARRGRGAPPQAMHGSAPPVPAGRHTGARHHNQHHNIFGSPPPQHQQQKPHGSPAPFSPTMGSPQQAAGAPTGPRVSEYAGTGQKLQGIIPQASGAAGEIGQRQTMEDAHEACHNLQEGVSFYVVCDGHSGRLVADMAVKMLPQVIKETDPRRLAAVPATVLTETFVRVDRQMFRNLDHRDGGGAACVAALVLRSDLYIANLGDSRAVLCEGGRAISLTKDHKPFDAAEAQRVRDHGGVVVFGRVGGCLAITRAFGDYELKNGDRVLQDGAPLPVSNVPDISRIKLTTDSEFLLLACDGVWDVLSASEAIAKCREHMAAGPRKMAQAVVMHALQMGTTDNVSALVVIFGENRHAFAQSAHAPAAAHGARGPPPNPQQHAGHQHPRQQQQQQPQTQMQQHQQHQRQQHQQQQQQQQQQQPNMQTYPGARLQNVGYGAPTQRAAAGTSPQQPRGSPQQPQHQPQRYANTNRMPY